MNDPKPFDQRHSDEALDRRLRAALHAAPVPSTAKQKTLNALRQAVSDLLPAADDDARPDLQSETAPMDGFAGTAFGSEKRSALESVAASEPHVSSAQRSTLRGVWIGLAVAAGICAILLSLYQATTPMTPQRLASLAIELTRALPEDEAAWQDRDYDAAIPALKQLQLRAMEMALIGRKRCKFATQDVPCDVWKFQSGQTKKVVYLVRAEMPHAADELGPRMRLIPSSGGWSVAAMKMGDATFLVVCDGSVAAYLEPSTFA